MGLEFNIENYLRLSWQDIVLTCISTLIIVLVARHFFWNKLLTFLDQRKALINADLAQAQETKNQAYRLRNEYVNQLDGLKEESEKILSKARSDADRESRRILEKARKQAEYIEDNARKEMEREREKSQREMEEAIGDVSFAIASQILKEQIDEPKARKMIDRFIEENERISP